MNFARSMIFNVLISFSSWGNVHPIGGRHSQSEGCRGFYPCPVQKFRDRGELGASNIDVVHKYGVAALEIGKIVGLAFIARQMELLARLQVLLAVFVVAFEIGLVTERCSGTLNVQRSRRGACPAGNDLASLLQIALHTKLAPEGKPCSGGESAPSPDLSENVDERLERHRRQQFGEVVHALEMAELHSRVTREDRVTRIKWIGADCVQG